MTVPALVAFSHVRWDSPYRRAREILTRLAQHMRVLYVEEPFFHPGDPRAELRAPVQGVTVLTPHTPLNAPGFHDDQIPLLSKLVANALAREQMHDYGAWLQTPMALPLLQKLGPRFIVYDCVADLHAMPGAPRQLAQREHALLRMANAVLCASPGLRQARSALRSDAQCVADSVDAAHFAHAASAHPSVRALARPRLGYAGVLDERIDFDLLREIALARPEWEICLVGPTVRIAADLPRAPNLHYFGACAYAELPAHMAGWDVALLPIARGDPTHFATAATALEYMAAARPIVSTRIADLARSYGDLIRFGASSTEFIAACDAALTAPEAERLEWTRCVQRIIAATAWDDTVRRIHGIVATAAAKGPTAAAHRMLGATHAPSPLALSAPSRSPCVVLGAGATGLAAAYHYGDGCTLVEREQSVGGRCRSIEDTGFTFDCGGHAMVSEDPGVLDLYRLLLGDNVHWQECEARVIGDAAGSPRRLVQRTHTFPAPGTRFGYPLRGGYQALMDGFLSLLRGDLVLGADVRRVSPLLRAITLADGRRLHYDVLVSTLPLPVLVAAMEEEAPAEIRRAVAALHHTSLCCVNLGIARPHVTACHWIEFCGDTVFARVFAPGNASPHCNPRGGFGLTCEIPYANAAPLPATGAALTDRCVRDLVRVGLLDRSDALLTSNHVTLRYAGIDAGADEAARIRDWLAQFDIVPAGRFGAWHDDASIDAFVAGRNAALAARRGSVGQVAASA